jgi:hypothetical protein
MGTEPQDPNEEHDREIAAGKDHPALSQDELYGDKLNPVRETENVATNLHDGPAGAR